jgi:hypothetical protein
MSRARPMGRVGGRRRLRLPVVGAALVTALAAATAAASPPTRWGAKRQR